MGIILAALLNSATSAERFSLRTELNHGSHRVRFLSVAGTGRGGTLFGDRGRLLRRLVDLERGPTAQHRAPIRAARLARLPAVPPRREWPDIYGRCWPYRQRLGHLARRQPPSGVTGQAPVIGACHLWHSCPKG